MTSLTAATVSAIFTIVSHSTREKTSSAHLCDLFPLLLTNNDVDQCLLVVNHKLKYTVPKVIDFPRYNMKCSGENVILREIFHVVSCFPLHFMLYHGNLGCFSNSVCIIGQSWGLGQFVNIASSDNATTYSYILY